MRRPDGNFDDCYDLALLDLAVLAAAGVDVDLEMTDAVMHARMEPLMLAMMYGTGASLTVRGLLKPVDAPALRLPPSEAPGEVG